MEERRMSGGVPFERMNSLLIWAPAARDLIGVEW
jgi:hypothetical protein